MLDDVGLERVGGVAELQWRRRDRCGRSDLQIVAVGLVSILFAGIQLLAIEMKVQRPSVVRGNDSIGDRPHRDADAILRRRKSHPDVFLRCGGAHVAHDTEEAVQDVGRGTVEQCFPTAEMELVRFGIRTCAWSQ
jgi:hypothetical protein